MTASDVADELAQRVNQARPELRGKGYYIVVTNVDGDEIRCAPVRPLVL